MSRNPHAASLRAHRQQIVPDKRAALRQRIYECFSVSLADLSDDDEDGGSAF